MALERLLTTRGSLTYIGSYISGAKGLSGKSQVSRRMWGGAGVAVGGELDVGACCHGEGVFPQAFSSSEKRRRFLLLFSKK